MGAESVTFQSAEPPGEGDMAQEPSGLSSPRHRKANMPSGTCEKVGCHRCGKAHSDASATWFLSRRRLCENTRGKNSCHWESGSLCLQYQEKDCYSFAFFPANARRGLSWNNPERIMLIIVWWYRQASSGRGRSPFGGPLPFPKRLTTTSCLLYAKHNP